MMKAAVLYGKEDVRVEMVPMPRVASGEVRLKIRAALTCGTDLKVFRRGYHARMIAPPVPFGHEFAGTIDEVGPGVSEWRVGDRVVAANSAACQDCFYCTHERPELCEDLLFVNGAYAEYITIPERVVRMNMLTIPEHLTFEQAAMVEPLACVIRGLEFSPIKNGDSVAVIGVGPIGLFFVKLCALAGAQVTAIGRGKVRLAVAERMGANYLFSTIDTVRIDQKVRAIANGGRGPDVVIECVGSIETWELAIAMARPGGTVNLFGGCPKDTYARLDTSRVHYDELKIVGAFHHTPAAIREALRLISDGTVPASEFIQERAGLDDVPAVLARMAAGDSTVKTAILMPA